jgi:hypothetical protein
MIKSALDTNIVIFSHGSDIPGKQARARELLNSAPVISSCFFYDRFGAPSD